jgi:hypothetical protein
MAHIIYLGSTPLALLTSATKSPFSSHITFTNYPKRNIVYKFVGLNPTFCFWVGVDAYRGLVASLFLRLQHKSKSKFAVLEMSFTNLVRFEDDQGAIHYGDVPEDCLLDIIGCRVPILAGDPFEDSLQLTGQQAVVHKVLVSHNMNANRV